MTKPKENIYYEIVFFFTKKLKNKWSWFFFNRRFQTKFQYLFYLQTVSYTHLDVYKRQRIIGVSWTSSKFHCHWFRHKDKRDFSLRFRQHRSTCWKNIVSWPYCFNNSASVAHLLVFAHLCVCAVSYTHLSNPGNL